jgi:PAS domain S-box-containing protein
MDFNSQNYEYLSPAVESMLGYTPEELVEKGPSFILERIHPEDLKRIEQEVNEMKGKGVEDHFAKETKYRIKTKEGNYIWVNNRRRLLRDEDGNPVAFVGSIRDISEQERHEIKMQQSLKEKQTLLAEIHHRVKNNLAIISGLLHLQQMEADKQLHPVLEDMQSRIKSIAMIHEKLYQTDSFSEIDMKEYVQDFTQMVENTYSSKQQKIEMKENLESFTLDITRAVPLGLILNELLNNAFKHGFSDTHNGEIRIILKKGPKEILLSVEDNGHPLPDDFSLENSGSLGMTLIKTLSSQLDGTIDISQDEWTTFKITFPISQ